jgi:hypothetical protein
LQTVEVVRQDRFLLGAQVQFHVLSPFGFC